MAVVEIQTGEILEGRLPPKAFSMVLDWIGSNWTWRPYAHVKDAEFQEILSVVIKEIMVCFAQYRW